MHRFNLLFTSLALAIACRANAATDDRYDDVTVCERFILGIVGYLMDRFDTTARFDSTRFSPGTLIDLEENFNVDDSEPVLRIDVVHRFNKRHCRIDCCVSHLFDTGGDAGGRPLALYIHRLRYGERIVDAVGRQRYTAFGATGVSVQSFLMNSRS